MVNSKENNKFDLGVKGLNGTYTDQQETFRRRNLKNSQKWCDLPEKHQGNTSSNCFRQSLHIRFISYFYLLCQTLIIRFEMKKLSEMNEEYLGVESDDSEQELVDAQEEQDTADNQVSDQRMQHQRTPGSITVSRILKSNLACKGSF